MWDLSDCQGIEAIEPALGRIYRQGRSRHRRAQTITSGRARAMHRWRKRVKDLRYAAEILDRRDGDTRAGQSASGPDDTFIADVARRADELSELLGEEHDLVVLAARLRSTRKRQDGVGRRKRKLLLKDQIARLESQLIPDLNA